MAIPAAYGSELAVELFRQQASSNIIGDPSRQCCCGDARRESIDPGYVVQAFEQSGAIGVADRARALIGGGQRARWQRKPVSILRARIVDGKVATAYISATKERGEEGFDERWNMGSPVKNPGFAGKCGLGECCGEG
jgi:hypothetical protein